MASSPVFLVIESSRVFVMLYRRVARMFGAEVVWVQRFSEAVRWIEEVRPTCIFTSMEIGSFRANSLVFALRASPTHRPIPIAVVSSNVMPTWGYYRPDIFLEKGPDFIEEAKNWLEAFGLQVVSDGLNDPEDDEPLAVRVLLVEDGKVNQRIYSRYLHVAGFETTVAENGLEAIEAVSSSDFDCILMDIEMPKLDGRQATKRIRSMGITTPIFALTSLPREDFIQQALELGFSDVLAKNIPPQELVFTVRDALS